MSIKRWLMTALAAIFVIVAIYTDANVAYAMWVFQTTSDPIMGLAAFAVIIMGGPFAFIFTGVAVWLCYKVYQTWR